MMRTGQLADFVALSDDLFAVPHEKLRDVEVTAAVIGGDVVFDDGLLNEEVPLPGAFVNN